MATLDDYRSVAPHGQVDILRRLGARLQGRSLLHVNGSRSGGPSADILQPMLPLLRELGVEAGWEVVQGDEIFDQASAALYEALQGTAQDLAETQLTTLVETARSHAQSLPLEADVVVVHDHQPAALVEFRPQEEGQWVWRCHLDLARPERNAWAFLRPYVVQYDAAVFSLPKFAHRVPIPQFLVYPSIDPLSEKNRELSDGEIRAILERLEVPTDLPLVVQVSPFNRLKDPIGVVEAYQIVRRSEACRLVLAAHGPVEGDETQRVIDDLRERIGEDRNVHILELRPGDDLAVNALQRAATVVVQKSLREGFGLAVAEAMWKGKPVVGGAAGGITAQLVYDATGFTVHSPEGCAFRIRQLLNDPELAERMGSDAREFARRHFLITRNLGDYLALMKTLLA